jgi:hypothetical protein
MIRACVAAVLAVLVATRPAAGQGGDAAAIRAAREGVERAAPAAKLPGQKAAAAEALAALKKLGADDLKPSERVSDFVDEAAKYKGRVVTFRVRYSDRPGLTALRDRVGDTYAAPFTAVDPKNGAKLVLGVVLPVGLPAPAARDGEEVVVTFWCGQGDTGKGNVALVITRP